MLGAVARSLSNFAAQDHGYVAGSAEHVPGLTDLIEQLIGGHPHEVRVHELDDWAKATIERHAATEPRERVLTDWGPQNSIGEAILQSTGSAIRPSIEPVDVLTENHDAIVGFHPTIHHPSYGVDELDLGRFPREVFTIGPAQPLEFAEISANADIHKGWVGPF